MQLSKSTSRHFVITAVTPLEDADGHHMWLFVAAPMRPDEMAWDSISWTEERLGSTSPKQVGDDEWIDCGDGLEKDEW